MNTLSERIRQIIDYHGISISAFERKIECKEGVIQKFLQRNTDLNTKNITNIALFFPNLSATWLLTGEGNMLKLDEKKEYNLTSDGKNSPNVVGNNNFFWDKKGSESLSSRVKPTRKLKQADKESGIPLVELSASAGLGTLDFAIETKDIIGYYVIPDFAKVDFMMRITGNSMSPQYESGDIIACRVVSESQFIQWGKPYLIATRYQGMLLKRLFQCQEKDCLEFRSDNPSYPPFNVNKDEITSIAIVVGSIHVESLY